MSFTLPVPLARQREWQLNTDRSLNYLYSIQERLNLPSGASFATVSTLAADLGNTVIFPALCTGGSLHIISQERATDPRGDRCLLSAAFH
jgi:hypothetical protein